MAYFGFSLTNEYPCTNADCFFNDTDTHGVYVLGVYPEEVELYRNALIDLRCVRAFQEHDKRYKEIQFPTNATDLSLMFFKCKTIISDYVGINRIADKAFQSVRFSVHETEFKGRVKTGYKEIDNFVNKFTLIDLDEQKIYSPFLSPFNTQIDNDFHKLLVDYSGTDIVPGFRVINNETFSLNDQTMTFDELSKDPMFDIIILEYIKNHCKGEPVIFITKEEVFKSPAYTKMTPRTEDGEFTILIGNYSSTAIVKDEEKEDE